MKTTIPLYIIALGITIIALQNAGIIPPVKTAKTRIEGTVNVTGSVDVDNTVNVTGSVEIDNTVDVGLISVAGHELVSSKEGMFIGVSSVKNTIIPIHWGEVSISR